MYLLFTVQSMKYLHWFLRKDMHYLYCLELSLDAGKMTAQKAERLSGLSVTTWKLCLSGKHPAK